jgi:predicted amidohydrolase
MQLIGVQLDIAWEDKPVNQQRVERLFAVNPPARGALVALPEMFATGFSLDVAKIDEASTGRRTERFLAELAEVHGVTVVGGLVRGGEDGRGLNQALVVAPDRREVTRYSKIHPFSFGDEHRCYTGGESIELFDWHGLRAAPMVCYDLRFPEVFRHAAMRGAEVFVVIANWPAARESHWVALLIARAIENQAYVLGVNRCGRDPKHTYSGRSLIIDPRGNVLADAGAQEGVIAAPVDAEALRAYRAEFPALSDVRKRFLGL